MYYIYINDLDVNLNSYVLKLADDAKVFSQVSYLDKVANLQSDLDKLHKWSEDWQMMFNAQKCKCLHIGYKNTYANYSIGGVEVTNSSCERDLGVVIDECLNYSRQCSKAVLSANKIMGIINRTYSCKSKDNILNLHKSLVRPHLEYCCQAWRPYLQKDVDRIEKVQRRMTKMIPELSQLNYEERLCRTNLLSLEMRRLRADLIEVLKIVKGIENVDQYSFFQRSKETRTRGHMHKFFLPSFRLNLRKFSFSQRVVSEWNSLLPKAVNQTTFNGFKNIIDNIFRKRRGLHISQNRLSAQFLRPHQRSSLVGSSELFTVLSVILPRCTVILLPASRRN